MNRFKFQFVSGVMAALTSMLMITIFVFDGVDEIAGSMYPIAIGAVAASVAALTAAMLQLQLARAKRREDKVYLIYADEDRGVADLVGRYLAANGILVFDRESDIPAGTVWTEKLIEEIARSSLAVAIISQGFGNSAWAKKELSVALQEIRPNNYKIGPVIPMVIGNAELPENLSNVRAVIGENERAMADLLKSISMVISSRVRTS